MASLNTELNGLKPETDKPIPELVLDSILLGLKLLRVVTFSGPFFLCGYGIREGSAIWIAGSVGLLIGFLAVFGKDYEL